MRDELKIFSGRAHPELGHRIAERLSLDLGRVACTNFRDGEIRVKIDENVRGVDAFVIQPTPPPADNLLELLLLIDALKRASADRITAVIPYYGYARQDRKDEPRVPISAKLIADLIVTAGASRVLTMDLHVEQIQGFFNIPVDHLYSMPVLINYFAQAPAANTVVVAPDTGSANRARALAKRLGNLPIAIIDKRRPQPNQAVVANVVGEVDGCSCVLFDDMIDTGGTLIDGARALIERGAREVIACATHPVLSGQAAENLLASPIARVVVTDTIPLPAAKQTSKTVVLSVAGLLAKAIERIHNAQSVSSLFV